MATRKKPTPKTRSVAGKTKTKTSQPAASKAKKPNAAVGMAAATDRFVKDLLIRGDAAKPDSTGAVPRDATHVIENQNEDGTTVVRRVRYKLF
ncbi:MAG TPA: hypothetical protein VNW47_09310 [Terriglobales bacterium]|jgi:hypothetical protein|nr:hypothetical protein [Terriglobales bacterium]